MRPVSITSADDPLFQLQVAHLAFHKARQRLEVETADSEATAASVFIPLTEALWWACSLDEGFKKYDRTTQTEEPSYEELRDSDAIGQIMKGVIYARNRCGHQRALAAVPSGGRSYPKTYPVIYKPVMFRWHPIASLPEPDPGHEHRAAATVYEKHLAGRPATEALRDIADWFNRAQIRVGSDLGELLAWRDKPS